MTALLKSGVIVALFGGVIFGQGALPAPAGQESNAAQASGALKRIIQCMVEPGNVECRPNTLAAQKPPRIVLRLTEPAKVCAARLLEAPLPGENEFTTPQIRPGQSHESIPLANLPAPPCPKASR